MGRGRTVMERMRRGASTLGQTEAEYAVVVAALAVGAIVVVLFFGGALSGLWDRSSKPVTPATFSPPTVTTTFSAPTKESDCTNGGWKTYTDLNFADESACITYVHQHGG